MGDPRIRDQSYEPASADPQPVTQANFVLPGAILVAIGTAFATFRIARLHAFPVDWIWVKVVYLLLWVAFALAFALVAMRCAKAQQALSIFAWLTCAGASVRAGYWGFLLVDDAQSGAYYAYGHYLPLLTAVALIAFGISAHEPFRWWWSVPAMIAGALDARSSVLGLYRLSPYMSLLWLIPLVVLGIAMCRTRVAAERAAN